MSKAKHQETILVICTGLILIFLVTKIKVLVTIAFLLGVIGISSPYLSSKIHWLWMKIAHILGYVNSKILLSAVFFLILTPVAFLMKLRKKDELKLKKTEAKTGYETRDHLYTSSDLEDAW